MQAGCAPGPTTTAPVTPAQPATDVFLPYRNYPSTEVYRVDPQQTILRIHVSRAGPLAHLGHNHIISTRDIEGRIYLPMDITSTHADLLLRADNLQVDDPELRRQAGTDYSSVPSSADKAGTRENMLGPAVLDALHYPLIRISIRLLGRDSQEAELETTIYFKKHEITRTMHGTLEIRNGVLSINTRFDLNHDDLGLRPFSVLGGALRVGESIHFELELKATTLSRITNG